MTDEQQGKPTWRKTIRGCRILPHVVFGPIYLHGDYDRTPTTEQTSAQSARKS